MNSYYLHAHKKNFVLFCCFAGCSNDLTSMKCFRREVWVHSSRRHEFNDITSQVQECVESSGIREGVCIITALEVSGIRGVRAYNICPLILAFMTFSMWTFPSLHWRPCLTYAIPLLLFSASVFANHYEPVFSQEFCSFLEKVSAQETKEYRHKKYGTIKLDSCIKRHMLGRGVVVSVTDGALDLASSETLLYADFEGERCERVLIKIMGAWTTDRAATRYDELDNHPDLEYSAPPAHQTNILGSIVGPSLLEGRNISISKATTPPATTLTSPEGMSQLIALMISRYPIDGLGHCFWVNNAFDPYTWWGEIGDLEKTWW